MKTFDHNIAGSSCIEFAIPVENRVDVSEVCRAIEYLGGIQSGHEFAFPSVQRRDEALAILCKKYGASYFAATNTEAKEQKDNA
jgi:hypothetical protein